MDDALEDLKKMYLDPEVTFQSLLSWMMLSTGQRNRLRRGDRPVSILVVVDLALEAVC